MHLIPTPKILQTRQGSCKLDGLPIVLATGQDIRLTDAAHILKGELEQFTGTKPTVYTGKADSPCILIDTAGTSGEGYTLTVSEEGVSVVGQGPAGTFYAIQTLRQLIKNATDRVLPCLYIEDEPDFALRGFYHDVTRGKVPTLHTLKQLADTLAFYKVNMLQLYIEDAFAFRELEGIMQPHEVLTPEEIRELDDYCYGRFVELTPSISTFGHLYRLLQSPRYRHLCEYEDFVSTRHPWIEKMMHHTIDVSNPQSIQVICSMIDQFVGLCRSDRFNICCDETFDLCKGRNAGKDVGEAYFGFVNQIIRHVKSHRKQVMMWGDIVLQHPEKVKDLPSDTVMLNWNYCENPEPGAAIAFEKAGFPQVVCPGTSTWNRHLEDIGCSKGNITGMAHLGKSHGAMGILNTNWGDFGNVGNANAALYGLVLGAQAGWHTDAPVEQDYEMAFSFLAYGQRVNMAAIIRKLNACERLANWGSLVGWLSANRYEGQEVPLTGEREELCNALQKCLALQAELAALPETLPVSDLQLTARMIELMLRLYLYGIHAEPKPDVEPVLAEYRAQWLRENKLSQLGWIEHTLRWL